MDLIVFKSKLYKNLSGDNVIDFEKALFGLFIHNSIYFVQHDFTVLIVKYQKTKYCPFFCCFVLKRVQ